MRRRTDQPVAERRGNPANASAVDFKPIATSVQSFQTRYSRDWGLTSAASMIMVVPIVILFLLLQRQFIEGLTRGGLKG